MDKDTIYCILILIGAVVLMMGLILSAQNIAEHQNESNDSSNNVSVDNGSNDDEESNARVIIPISGSDGSFAII